jgi:hypothetical protein
MAKTLQGAPPGFASNSKLPFPDSPAMVKSTNNSPKEATSGIKKTSFHIGIFVMNML